MGFLHMHRNIQVRILSAFMGNMVGSMIYPFMAIYFSSRLGSILAGSLLLFNMIVSSIVGLYGGYIADTIGRKKVLITGMSIISISYVFITIANSPLFDSVWLTFFLMTLVNIGMGINGPAAEAMLIDVSTPEERKLMYTIFYWAMNLSVMVGTMVGGLFFKEHRFELFMALTVVSFINLSINAFFIVDAYKVKKVEKKPNVFIDIVHNYKIVVKHKAFMVFLLAAFLVNSVENQLGNYIGVRLSKQFNEQVINLFWLKEIPVDGYRMLSFLTAENTFLVVCTALVIVKLTKNFNQKNVLYAGIVLFVGGYAVIAFSNVFYILLIAGFILTIGELMWVPVEQATFATIVDEQARGSYIAVSNLAGKFSAMSGSIGIIIGSFIGSYGMAVIMMLLGIGSIFFFRKSLTMHEAHQVKEIGA